MLPLIGPKTFETRGHCLKIQKRYCRTKLRANFFGFRTVNMWNGLPDDATLKLNSFKGRVDRHWRSLRYCFLIVSADDLTIKVTLSVQRPTMAYLNLDSNTMMTMMMTKSFFSHASVVEPFFGFAHSCEERAVLGTDGVDAVPLRHLLVIWQEILST